MNRVLKCFEAWKTKKRLKEEIKSVQRILKPFTLSFFTLWTEFFDAISSLSMKQAFDRNQREREAVAGSREVPWGLHQSFRRRKDLPHRVSTMIREHLTIGEKYHCIDWSTVLQVWIRLLHYIRHRQSIFVWPSNLARLVLRVNEWANFCVSRFKITRRERPKYVRPPVPALHTNNNIFSFLFKSSLVTVIPPTVSVWCSLQW